MAISIEGKEGPGLMTNTDKLDRAKTLSKEITMYKTMRNRVHKDIRGHKANRDEANNLVANLISKAKELEVKRNTLNRSVGQLKTSRDIYTGLIKETKMKRHQTGTSQNAAQQSALHRKVKNEARRSQKAQHELNSVGKEIQIATKIASDSHKEMLKLREMANEYHQEVVTRLQEFNKIKLELGTDFIDFNQEEE